MQFEIDRDIDVLIVYGLFDNLPSKVDGWLRAKKRVILLEDDISVYKRFLKEEKGFLKRGNVDLYFSSDSKEIFKKVSWKVLFLKRRVLFSRDKERLSKELDRYFRGVELTFSDYADFKKRDFKNISINLLRSERFRRARDLEGSFQGVPAIVVGAAPTVSENIEIIRDLSKKALILAGGNAVSMLLKNGIKPHFAAAIDGRARSLDRDLLDISFVYQNRINYENLELGGRNRILAPSNGYFPLEGYLERRLNIHQGSFDGGWTSSTFLIAFSDFLGCSPIFFTGVDLSFSGDRKYFDVEGGVNSGHIKVERGGAEVYTQKDWLAAAEWIEDFSKRGIPLYNCNRGGIFIKGVLKRELSGDLFKREYDIDRMMEEALEKSPALELLRGDVMGVLNDVRESLYRSLLLIEGEIEKMNVLFSTGGRYLESKKLLGELFYREHMRFIWEIFSPFIDREHLLDRVDFSRNLKKLLFLKGVAEDFLGLWKDIG